MRRPWLPTPTPWQIKNEYESTVIIGNVDGPSEGQYSYATIADTNALDLNERDLDAANAAYIVKCVNNHDALVRLCRDLLDELDEMPTDSALVETDRQLLATLA